MGLGTSKVQAPPRKSSKVCAEWLDFLSKRDGVLIIPEYRIVFGGRKHYVDGFCVETDTVYEFYGDYWHGNINVHSPSKKWRGNKTYGDKYAETRKREQNIMNAGFNLVSIWESEWKDLKRKGMR